MIKRIVNTSPGWDNPSDSEGLFLFIDYSSLRLLLIFRF
nr:MAG TPA: hypothetical protein [Caudoviricetes sp.]